MENICKVQKHKYSWFKKLFDDFNVISLKLNILRDAMRSYVSTMRRDIQKAKCFK